MKRNSIKSLDVSSEMTFEEKLIAAIKKHTCLYDKYTVNYRKRAVKHNAWQTVAEDVRSNVKECQHRWRSLRDRYVREIREQTNCKWRYMNHLSFLNPHLRNSYINNTDEESCSALEALTPAIQYEKETEFMKHKGTETFEGITKIDVEDTELEMEDTDDEIEEIPAPNPMTFVAFPCDSHSTLTPTTTITPKFNKDTKKRKRVDSVESNGSRISIVSEITSAEIENTVKSRNEDYYKTLDSYMLQLPLSLQDDLKIEILNRVYCEIKKQKPF